MYKTDIGVVLPSMALQYQRIFVEGCFKDHPNMTYDNALENLNIKTLFSRRESLCLTFFNKVVSDSGVLAYLSHKLLLIS